MGCQLFGEDNPAWKGGKRGAGSGYISVPAREHPRANSNNVLEHILVMEKHLGRPLVYISMGHKNNEIVHHKNNNKADNSISNLQLMTHSEHMALHLRIRRERGEFVGCKRGSHHKDKL